MSVPKSVIRINKNGIQYISSVDRVEYTLVELTRAALRDVGKFVCRRTNEKLQTLRGMKKNKRVRGSNGACQYWARSRECDLQVGIKHGTWYGTEQEIGSSKMKKHGFLTNTVRENIPTIIEIEKQYLSALNGEPSLANISEGDYRGGDE